MNYIQQFISLFKKRSNPSEIRFITPPKLESEHMSNRILCSRPYRLAGPFMQIAHLPTKIVAHNYGHAGSGWALGPGSVHEVITQLEKTLLKEHIKKDEPIAIIGAGIIGLLSAHFLVNKGYKAIHLYAESYTNLASHQAGAQLSIGTIPVKGLQGNQIICYSYEFYQSIKDGKHPSIKKGVYQMPIYFTSRNESGYEAFVGKLFQPAKDVILDFGNGTQRKMVVYDDGVYINPYEIMEALKLTLEANVTFIHAKINQWNELSEKIIVNCAGLGAKDLVPDSSISPVQGHLIMLKNQIPEHLTYSIVMHIENGITRSGHKVKRFFYLFPKKDPHLEPSHIGVMGGTYVEAPYSIRHEEEYEIILNQAKRFYGIK